MIRHDSLPDTLTKIRALNGRKRSWLARRTGPCIFSATLKRRFSAVPSPCTWLCSHTGAGHAGGHQQASLADGLLPADA